MNSKAVIWTVGIKCEAEDESKFNTWYDDVHVPMLLKGDFVKKVTRFKVADEAYHVGTTTQVCPTYLTIYEFENQDKFESWMNSPARAEAGDDKVETWGENCYEVQMACKYNLIKSWNQ